MRSVKSSRWRPSATSLRLGRVHSEQRRVQTTVARRSERWEDGPAAGAVLRLVPRPALPDAAAFARHPIRLMVRTLWCSNAGTRISATALHDTGSVSSSAARVDGLRLDRERREVEACTTRREHGAARPAISGARTRSGKAACGRSKLSSGGTPRVSARGGLCANRAHGRSRFAARLGRPGGAGR